LSGAIQPPSNAFADFQEKVLARLRSDIGSLMPEEALRELVRRAVEDSFFKERVTPPNNPWSNESRRPSWFVEEVTKVAKPAIEAESKRFVAENADVLKKALADFLTRESLLLMVMANLREATAKEIADLSERMRQVEQRG
jgi:hypothetical protein